MKRAILGGLFGVIFQSLDRFATLRTGIRLTALGLILVMLVPCFIFNPMWKTNANTKLQESAPNLAPPLSFEVSSSGFESVQSYGFSRETTSEARRFLTPQGVTLNFSDFFTAPALPEGFEAARTSSPFSDYLASLGSIFAPTVSALSQPAGNIEFDFDGDDKADISRYRGTATDWQIKQSSNGNTTNLSIGSVGSTIAPGDFDGDGTTDRAVFNTGTWTIKRSSDSTTQTITFGTSGDKPVTGDYDGDGKSDAAVFRASTNTWWILNSGNGNYTSTSFGAAGDITAQGNYDGDSKTDIAIFRPSTGDWHILGSLVGYFTLHWGIASDIPTPADFDADGKTDCAVYRGSTGTWYVYKSSTNNGEYLLQTWGNYGDQPVPADYDGDSKADFAVFRPTTGVWHIIKSSNATYDYQTLGMAGDVAVSSAYLKQIGGTVFGYDLAKARLEPKNATGGTNLYSQNFSWGTGLVGLSGRAGMNAGFGISYNSLVWTKDAANNSIVFDADNANVSPGFRFGFPTIEPTYYNSERKAFAYLMVTPSGARVEFNQIGASEFYETSDSSYTQLKTIGASDPNTPIENISIVITTTNGSTMNYEWKAGAFRCSNIKDRNGNYVSINHDSQGILRTVTDTLGRIINVNYDSQLYPTSITQTWKTGNGAGSDITHTYATFAYNTTEINTNFSGLTVIGPANGTNIKTLQKITFPTETNGAGPNTIFEYNSWGQVKQINNYAADNHKLNHVKVNLPADAGSSQTDCPRFTETKSYAENFNSGNEIIVNNSLTENAGYSTPAASGTATKIEVSMTDDPYNSVMKTFVGATGWQEGLPIVSEDWADGTGGLERKRWTWTNYTQDDVSEEYILNPRVTESQVGDTGNIKKTEIDYRLVELTEVAEYGLVSEVRLFDGNTNVLQKKSTSEYNLSEDYVSRRIIGLPLMSESWGLNQITNALEKVSKVTFQYDEGTMNNSALGQNIAPIQHDNTNFSSTFVAGRGNLTSTTRHDVTGQTANVTTSAKYNTAGAAVEQTDAGGRKVEISYADVFNDDNNSRNTFAYPTKLIEVANTDTTNNYSSVKYRFDTGANVWAKSPKPENNSSGKETTRLYDEIGRLQKETLVNTGAYTRYEYPTNNIQSKVYATVIDTNNNGADAADEVYAESWADGAGRVRQARTEHPNSSGGWTGTLTEYDILGRVSRSTVPTEINASYEPAGDDATRGWLWTQQEYDWKSRVTRSIHPDSNGSDGKDMLYAYDGCGCAGGQVTTVQGELVPRDDNPTQNARRTQKVYEDILGRVYKTEVLNWDNSVYSTAKSKFNGRDQAIEVKEFQGADTSSTFQTTTATFDGHGRPKTQHLPQQDTNAVTTTNYNADGSISQVTDGRGASANYSYNGRGLLSQISYTVPNGSNIQVTPTVTYSYDAVGNRTQMTDGLGTQTYAYDQLSRLTSETRSFTNFNSYTLNYTYGLAGQLVSIADADDSTRTISYVYEKNGSLKEVNGGGFGNVTNYLSSINYHAFGSVKAASYGSGKSLSLSYNNRLQASNYTVSNTANTNYEYYADGNLKSVSDQIDNRFDRLNRYDHLGRITKARSGLEARDETQTSNDRPFRQDYAYTAFNNLAQRNGKNWAQTYNHTDTFVNNRRQNYSSYNFNHDADGRDIGYVQTNFERATNNFDASGKRISVEEDTWSETYSIWQNRWNIVQNYDGDGQRLKQQENSAPWATYFVRSSVMGGAVVMELNKVGDTWLKDSFVYALDEMVARQKQNYNNTNEVQWNYENPLTGAQRGTIQTEPDALGVDQGLSQRQPNPPISSGSGIMDPGRYSDAFNGRFGCTMDGAPTSCDAAWSCIASEACDFGPAKNQNQSGAGAPPARRPPTLINSPNSSSRSRATRPRIVPNPASATRPRIVPNPTLPTRPRIVVNPPLATRPRIVPDIGTVEVTVKIEDADNPAVNVRKVYDLLKNPICAKFLNGVLRELQKLGEDQDESRLTSLLSILDENENDFRDYFESIDQSGAFHNVQLPKGVLGGTQSSDMIQIDVSQAGPSGTLNAVEYTAIHEVFHPAPGGFIKQATHYEMARAAYKVGMSQGLFEGLKNIQPVTRRKGKRSAETRNSNRFDRMMYAACPPEK